VLRAARVDPIDGGERKQDRRPFRMVLSVSASTRSTALARSRQVGSLAALLDLGRVDPIDSTGSKARVRLARRGLIPAASTQSPNAGDHAPHRFLEPAELGR
jgi:hypothetical protein